MQATEPANFDSLVRIPGNRFLARKPNPTPQEWSRKALWRKVHDDLYSAYSGICSYCASWTPRRGPVAGGAADHTSVDHYVPKSQDTSLAYEWSNYRLARSRLNHRKDNWNDVLDPVAIGVGWFYLDFTTYLLAPNGQLNKAEQQLVWDTINRLQLNTDQDYVSERVGVITEYAKGNINWALVNTRYPFIAEQMTAQDFDNNYKDKIKQFLAGTGST